MLFFTHHFDLEKQFKDLSSAKQFETGYWSLSKILYMIEGGNQLICKYLIEKVNCVLWAVINTHLHEYAGPIIWLRGALQIHGYNWVTEGYFTDSFIHLWLIWVQWFLLVPVFPWRIWILFFTMFVTSFFLIWTIIKVKIDLIWSWAIDFLCIRFQLFVWLFPRYIFIKQVSLWILLRHRFMFVWWLPPIFLS